MTAVAVMAEYCAGSLESTTSPTPEEAAELNAWAQAQARADGVL